MTIQQLIQTKKEEAQNEDFTMTHDAFLKWLEATILETAKLVVENLVPEEMVMTKEMEDEFQRVAGQNGLREARGQFNAHNMCRNQIISNARAMGITE